jgi:hypothetical protein
MSSWLDKKYIHLIAVQLEQFKWKGPDLANYRCFLCGDSKKHKYKARGYLYPHKGKWFAKCQNCSVALPFSAFLKRVNRRLYDEYIVEKLTDERPIPTPPATHPLGASVVAAKAPEPDYPVFTLSAVADASNRLSAVYRYALDVRQLPPVAFTRLFATEAARSWLEPLVGTEKAGGLADGTPYLVQPFRLPDGSWFGAQLRSIAQKEFYTFRWRDDLGPLKMFGLDAWTPDKNTYVVEGPIDSLFLDNALSPCGSDLLQGVQILEESGIMPITAPRVYVWDNEPRNKDICRHLRGAIAGRESVVIWPKNGFKDLNDMVRAGVDVKALVQRRTFSGLDAEREFSQWR